MFIDMRQSFALRQVASLFNKTNICVLGRFSTHCKQYVSRYTRFFHWYTGIGGPPSCELQVFAEGKI